MFKHLQKKYMARMILTALLCWLGVIFLIQMFMMENNLDSIPDLMQMLRQEEPQEPQDFNSLSAEEIKEGMYVKGEIPAPIEHYTYWTEDRTMYDEYIIPVGDKYMGFSCEGITKDLLDENMKIYLWALKANDEEVMNSVKPVQVEGVIKKLSDESMDYYQQRIPYVQITIGQEISYIPYVFVEEKYSSTSSIDWSSEQGRGILILVLLGVSVYCIAGGIRRRNIKDLKKYFGSQEDLEYGLTQIERFYESGTPVHGLRLDNQYFLMVVNDKVHFIETRDIVWIYPNVTKHSVYYIPTRKTYAIKIKKRNGKELKIDIRNKKILDDLMSYIASQTPYIILGYDKEIELIYIRNRNEMAHEVDRRRQERLGVVAQTMEQPPEHTVPTGEDGFYENRNM